MGVICQTSRRGIMGDGAASAERPVYRGAPTPRKFPLVCAAIATALATAFWTAHFDPFTSVFDADMPEDTSTFFEERFAPATAPSPVGGSSIFNQSRPAEIEAKLQQAKPLLASKLTESNAQTQLSEKPARRRSKPLRAFRGLARPKRLLCRTANRPRQ